MVCSTYDEMTAALDRTFAVAEDEPLRIDEALATLAAEARPEVVPRPVGPEPGA
jgi:hypothetical protein